MAQTPNWNRDWLRKWLTIRHMLAVSFLSFAVLIGLLWRATQPFVALMPLEPSVFLEDHQGRFLAEFGDQDLGFWDYQVSLPPELFHGDGPLAGHHFSSTSRIALALLAIEDHRFPQHGGVDWRSLMRALQHNLSGQARQGASTLAMQVARMQRARMVTNEERNSTYRHRTYRNKFFETLIAWRLTRTFGREAVLRQYMKMVPLGNRMHGFAYAARRYFKKPVQDLGWAEAALLAGLPKAPGRMNLFRYQGLMEAKKRARIVLERLLELGLIDQTIAHREKNALDQIEVQTRQIRPESVMHLILCIQSDMPAEQRPHPLRLALDLELQEWVQDRARTFIDRNQHRGVGNMAVMVVERETGAILAYVGSAGYDGTGQAGRINYAQVPRSSGSTLKPFIYGFGLDDGHFTPASVLSDLPWHSTHASGHFSVFNYDFNYLGPMIYRRALANSRNIPAVQVLNKVGIYSTMERFSKLGLTQPQHRPEDFGLSLAIGGLYVTLEDLVRAYGSLANGGKDFALNWGEGLQVGTSAESVLSEASARQIGLFLSDPLARLPSFPQSKGQDFDRVVALKTGTSQSFRDAWCIAYSNRYLVGVWMGHPDLEPMNHVSGAVASEWLKAVFRQLPEKELTAGFPPPRGFVRTELCPLTGDLASPLCVSISSEYLEPGKVPRQLSRAHSKAKKGQGGGGVALDGSETIFYRGSFAEPIGNPTIDQRLDLTNYRTGTLAIRSPVSGTRVFLDPNIPSKVQSIPLEADISPRVPAVIWYVDGRPFKEVEYPYHVRWPLESGTHSFHVAFPHADIQSQVATVVVE